METRIKPHLEQMLEHEQRAMWSRAHGRKPPLGLEQPEVAICFWWPCHTNPKWIVPPGRWRL